MDCSSPLLECELADIIRSMQSGPGLLDWISGLVVPLLLGMLTLFVAVWAGRIAKASNAMVVAQHEELRADAARRLRVNLAHELSQLSGKWMAARLGGLDLRKVMTDDLEGMNRLQKAVFESGDDTAKKINSWVSQTSRNAELRAGDIDQWMELVSDISSMTELWLRDPGSAVVSIDGDARYRAILAGL